MSHVPAGIHPTHLREAFEELGDNRYAEECLKSVLAGDWSPEVLMLYQFSTPFRTACSIVKPYLGW